MTLVCRETYAGYGNSQPTSTARGPGETSCYIFPELLPTHGTSWRPERMATTRSRNLCRALDHFNTANTSLPFGLVSRETVALVQFVRPHALPWVSFLLLQFPSNYTTHDMELATEIQLKDAGRNPLHLRNAERLAVTCRSGDAGGTFSGPLAESFFIGRDQQLFHWEGLGAPGELA